MNRFKKFGGATPLPIYGYVVPPREVGPTGLPKSRTYDDWRIDPAATEVYRQWFRMLREGGSFAEVADWLNDRGVPTGPYARRKTWTAVLVRRGTGNSLLKGMPSRGGLHTVKYHETGRRVTVKNPKGPVFREYPHLAHVDPAEWDGVNALLTARNHGLGRKPVGGVDPRSGVPKKWTKFPGQHARCWYCGRRYVWGGNGVNGNLMCAGARDRLCWNSVSFSGAVAADRVAAAIAIELARLDGFDAQFRELVERASLDGGADLARRWADLEREQAAVAGRKENLLAAVAECGPMPMLRAKLTEIEADEERLTRRRRELERARPRPLRLPSSTAELRRLLEEQSRALALDSPEFGHLMRLVAPDFHVYLVRLADGGRLLPRARVTLSLAGVAPDAASVPGVADLFTRVLTLDLCDPPQRERIRADAARLAADGLEQRVIAGRLAEPATQTAVYRALALDRLVREKGLATPYVLATEPPPDIKKLRRHRHPRYRFEPAAGYQPPAL